MTSYAIECTDHPKLFVSSSRMCGVIIGRSGFSLGESLSSMMFMVAYAGSLSSKPSLATNLIIRGVRSGSSAKLLYMIVIMTSLYS